MPLLVNGHANFVSQAYVLKIGNLKSQKYYIERTNYSLIQIHILIENSDFAISFIIFKYSLGLLRVWEVFV